MLTPHPPGPSRSPRLLQKAPTQATSVLSPTTANGAQGAGSARGEGAGGRETRAAHTAALRSPHGMAPPTAHPLHTRAAARPLVPPQPGQGVGFQ